MKKSHPKIAYFTNIAPHYREKLWIAMATKLAINLHFYFGYKPTQSIKSIDFTTKQWSNLKNQVHLIENYEVNEILVYQSKVIWEVLFKKWDAVILLGHARIVTVWIAAIIARLKGIPVILWGHGLYGSEKGLKKVFLTTFLSLGDKVLVYGEYAKKLIINNQYKEENIKVIYNSINHDAIKELRNQEIITDYYHHFFNNQHPTLIFIGRLTKIKKLHLLIEALTKLSEKGKNYNLMLIGDGNAKQSLMELAKKNQVNVHFYGACYDERLIAKLIAHADLCISPGSVGLTAIHSMSYGTPVCTHNDFNSQGPEFEAITPWETGCFFDFHTKNIAETILQWFQRAPERNEVREKCFEVIDKKYNTQVQLKVLQETLEEVLN